MSSLEAVYIGKLENMVAEVAAFDPRTIGIPERDCKYLVTPVGSDDWDTEWHSSLASALANAKDIATRYGVKVCEA